MTLGAIYIHGVAPVMLGGVELSGAPQRDGAEFYDVIVFFGMDWLSRHRVVLDCLKARVILLEQMKFLLHACYILRSYGI